jgi:hypothetical protein
MAGLLRTGITNWHPLEVHMADPERARVDDTVSANQRRTDDLNQMRDDDADRGVGVYDRPATADRAGMSGWTVLLVLVLLAVLAYLLYQFVF